MAPNIADQDIYDKTNYDYRMDFAARDENLPI